VTKLRDKIAGVTSVLDMSTVSLKVPPTHQLCNWPHPNAAGGTPELLVELPTYDGQVNGQTDAHS